ncbi:hypothetical protein PLESTB_000067700 [Pleodorina starrii]|uniref:Uncharacterized protein n=2 Tax=Pleodorina starrii TaxID=330485 RepID=A0A9W6EWY9_9CHLO|nr:hypothetical protein PLESTM_001605600 [Pleodorina starrii]GLC48177.1 hypothetical protein PLESTB_000067700 [Pleodorina starrii]GLC67652.1 hypothetical protein PLESTF_000587000 [Pleodorina starrii]
MLPRCTPPGRTGQATPPETCPRAAVTSSVPGWRRPGDPSGTGIHRDSGRMAERRPDAGGPARRGNGRRGAQHRTDGLDAPAGRQPLDVWRVRGLGPRAGRALLPGRPAAEGQRDVRGPVRRCPGRQGLPARDLESLPALRDFRAPPGGIRGNAAQLAAQAVKLQVRKHLGALLRAQPKHDGPTHVPLMAEAIRNTVLQEEFKAARREGIGGSGSGHVGGNGGGGSHRGEAPSARGGEAGLYGGAPRSPNGGRGGGGGQGQAGWAPAWQAVLHTCGAHVVQYGTDRRACVVECDRLRATFTLDGAALPADTFLFPGRAAPRVAHM